MTDSATRIDERTDSELLPDGGNVADETDSEPDEGVGSGLSDALESDSSDEDSPEATVEENAVTKESRSPLEYLELAAVAGLVVVAVVTGIGVYSNASAAISRLISPSWVPVFQAGFNLALLLLALAGLSLLARRRLDLA